MQVSLFDPPVSGRVRRVDRLTSVEAARRQRVSMRAAIVDAFRAHGPMTDDTLAGRLAVEGFHGPSVKTARSALMRKGWIVDTGRVERTRRGSLQTVWALRVTA